MAAQSFRSFCLVGLLAFSSHAFARVEESYCSPDVLRGAGQLTEASRIEHNIPVNDVIWGHYYTKRLSAKLGLHNHMQGITRIRDTETFVISAANFWKKESLFFIGGPGAQQGIRPGLLARLQVSNTEMWHAGGVASFGDIAAMALENCKVQWKLGRHKEMSRIVFYDFSDPVNPELLPLEIPRPSMGISAVAIERLPDGRFIVAANDDTGIDIYYSRTSRIEDGFGLVPSRLNLPKGTVLGQSLQFVRQCDGRLFLWTLKNMSKVQGILKGKNMFHVYELSNAEGREEAPALEARASGKMECGKWCNFNASSSVSVGEDGGLRLYSTGYFRTEKGTQIPMAEFRERVLTQP